MSDKENIKNRVRKLMKLANDGEASSGEIDNALRAAAALIDKHHLNLDELTEEELDANEQTMSEARGYTESAKFHRWETTLAWAVTELFGSIKHYLPHEKIPFRVNGIVQMHTGKYSHQMKMRRQIAFYGPAHEVEEASELYTEWCHLIAAMGVIRWGGAYRGQGEAYCQGFADQLLQSAQMLNRGRNQIAAKAPRPLLGEAPETTKAITLRDRHEIIRHRAVHWLRTEKGVRLSKGKGQSGSSEAGGNAYREGREHGAQAGFGRNAKRKGLPGGRS